VLVIVLVMFSVSGTCQLLHILSCGFRVCRGCSCRCKNEPHYAYIRVYCKETDTEYCQEEEPAESGTRITAHRMGCHTESKCVSLLLYHAI
jgi:hypothetical protein